MTEELSKLEKVFEEGGVADLEGVPMNMEEVMAAMQKPPAVLSSVKPTIPLHPDLKEAQERAEKNMEVPVTELSVSEPMSSGTEESLQSEGPTEAMKKDMILPSEKEKAQLKKTFGHVPMRVVPIPYSRGDGKTQTYVLRQLNRAQWSAARSKAQQIAPNKPDTPIDEIFAEYIVREAVIWPGLPPHLHTTAAGLVETLFGIVQQMGLFYDPAQLMAFTFPL